MIEENYCLLSVVILNDDGTKKDEYQRDKSHNTNQFYKANGVFMYYNWCFNTDWDDEIDEDDDSPPKPP